MKLYHSLAKLIVSIVTLLVKIIGLGNDNLDTYAATKAEVNKLVPLNLLEELTERAAALKELDIPEAHRTILEARLEAAILAAGKTDDNPPAE